VYYGNITIVDEYNGEQLGNITIPIRMHITWDVIETEVSPSTVKSGQGQPAQYDITIMNKGAASDVFEVSAVGPKRWAFKKQIFVPAHSSKIVRYEIAGDEPGIYQNTIKVVSASSEHIASDMKVTLEVKQSLFVDYGATNRGTILFPIFEAPTYAIAGLLSNIAAIFGV